MSPLVRHTVLYYNPLSSDFWKYFEPIRQNMPQNCSADVQAVIRHIDSTFTGTNATAIQGIKDMFGMTGVTHLDDVAGARRCIFASDGPVPYSSHLRI